MVHLVNEEGLKQAVDEGHLGEVFDDDVEEEELDYPVEFCIKAEVPGITESANRFIRGTSAHL